MARQSSCSIVVHGVRHGIIALQSLHKTVRRYLIVHGVQQFHHSIIPSFHHSIIPSFHHSIIHSIIPSFHHSIIPSFHLINSARRCVIASHGVAHQVSSLFFA